MKKITLLAILISFGFAFTTPSQAQISLNGIKRQAEKSLSKAIEKKVEKELDKIAQGVVDKYWDRVLGKYYQGMYQTGTDSQEKPIYPFIMDANVKLNDVYRFDHMLRMKMDTYNKSGKLEETVFISSHTNVNGNYLGTSIESKDKKSTDQDFFIINDFDNDAMVMLSEENGEKSKVAFSFLLDENAVDNMANVDSDLAKNEVTKYKEIGTKVILGYTCRGYVTEDDEQISEMWISEKPIPGTEKAVAMLSKNKKMEVPEGYPKGSLMETTVTNKKTKEKFVMKVVEINPNKKMNFTMADYESANTDGEK